MRCARCGNENPATNRFCGMCGASLLQTGAPSQANPSAAPASQGPAAAPAAGTVASAPAAVPAATAVARPAPVATPAAKSATSATPPAAGLDGPKARPETADGPSPAPRPQAARSEEAPIISGPSFLGLNEPAPSARRRNPLSIDPHASSGNLDYLLEDDEQPKGGAWKFVLIVIALALAVGFGYLRWRGQGVPWLGSRAVKPAAATQSSEAAESTSAAPSSPTAATAPGTSQAAPVTPPNATGPAAGGSSSVAPSSAASSSGTAASATPTSAAPASGTSPTNAAAGTAQPVATPSGGDVTGASGAAATAQPAAANSGAPATTAPPTPAPTLPRKARVPAAPPKPIDPVAEAQKYIYGKHARQDCDRGLRLLKPAAEEANPRAMIEMGALYSAGLCTPRDLPTAYRWFALALRKDPDNVSLQADLNKLWGEMTQPERQLAIRLSQ